jgi:triacylglycerol lipase
MNHGYHYAVLSQYAYLAPEKGIPAYEELGYTNIEFYDRKNSQCYLLETDTHLVVAIRGTETSESSDIKTDLNFCKTKSKTAGGVHEGFYDDTNELWSGVTRYINDESRKDKKVWFCGHSMGGAIATIFCSRLKIRVASCYTYGSPRVGNKRWVRSLGFSHHRFVNNNDIVPRIPPLWLGYRHYGELHYINYYGNIRNLTPWQRFKDMLRGYRKAWSKGECFDSLRDHSITCYVKQLRNL